MGGCILPLTFLAGALTALDAHAAYVVCRTDPTVTLSNGMVVTMYADIQDTASDIKNVSYQLHGPRGTRVTGISYDAYGSLETVTYSADQAAGSFNVYAGVTTGAPRARFSMYAQASKNGSPCSPTEQASGRSNTRAVSVQFHC